MTTAREDLLAAGLAVFDRDGFELSLIHIYQDEIDQGHQGSGYAGRYQGVVGP